MLKNSKKATATLALLLVGASLQGCYGNFALTRKLYTWNGTLGDKWINSIATWVMMIIPVYGVVGAVDFVILNTIQFWTGANPVTMAPGEKEIQLVNWKGEDYILTASHNRLDVSKAKGDPKLASLVFDPATKSWYGENGSDKKLLAQWADAEGKSLDLVMPDGSRQRVGE
jgi:hypothetical protein